MFCIDSHVMLFSLERKNTQASKSIVVEHILGYITCVMYRLTCHVVPLERKNTQASKSIVLEHILGYITGVLF